MCRTADRTRVGDVLRKGKRGAVVHDRAKPRLDRAADDIDLAAVIEVQADGHIRFARKRRRDGVRGLE